MAQHLWLIYALSASVLWGIAYAVSEKILKENTVSPAFLMITVEVITLPIYLFVAIHWGQFKNGIAAIMDTPHLIGWLILHAVALIGGTFLIFYSIVEKNATLATMIEISYPFFVAIFAYVLFKDTQLTWWTAFAGLLVFSGIAVIFFKG